MALLLVNNPGKRTRNTMAWWTNIIAMALRSLVLIAMLIAPAMAQDGTNARAQIIVAPLEDAQLNDVLTRHLTLPEFMYVGAGSRDEWLASVKLEATKLEALLQGYGYLEATVDVTVADGSPETVLMTPVPGSLYKIGWIRVDGSPPDNDGTLSSSLNSLLNDRVGKDADRQTLAELRRSVTWTLGEASFANAAVSKQDFILEPDTGTVGIVLAIEPGPPVVIGDVRVEGAASRRLDIARNLVPIEPGDPYRASVIDAIQTDLEATGLFRRVRISLAGKPDRLGRTTLRFELRDGPSDPVQLKESSGLGPLLLMITMLLVVFRECIRATRYWRNVAFRSVLTLLVVLMTAASGVLVVQRIAVFLS